MTDLVDARPAVPSPRRPQKGLVGPHWPHPAEPPSVHPEGVELTRLVARAQLTVAQGVELAAAVTVAAVRWYEPAGAGPGRTPLLAGPVLIGADGRVVAGPSAHGGGDATTAAAGPPPGTPLAPVLADLAAAVRPRARHAGPAAERLVAELDAAVAELPVGGVASTARRLQEVAAGFDRRTVRGELGALVRAIGGHPAPPGGPSTVAPPAAALATPRRPATPARTGTTRRRIGAWLPRSWSSPVSSWRSSASCGPHRRRRRLAPGRRARRCEALAGRAPSPAPGRPLPAPAPAAAGGVAGVDLRARRCARPVRPAPSGCRCGSSPGADSRPCAGRSPGWPTAARARRCRLPAAPSPRRPAATRVEAVGVVALPAAVPAVAVFAVTDAPAAAASPRPARRLVPGRHPPAG